MQVFLNAAVQYYWQCQQINVLSKFQDAGFFLFSLYAETPENNGCLAVEWQ